VTETAAATPTIGDALRGATARLANVSDTPRLDAELLLAHVLGCGRERLVLDRDRPLDRADVRHRFDALVARRDAHEPVAYLLGRRGFRHLTLSVDRRVLIPRPETELLVEGALSLPFGASALDVGTGSGAVALALKHERPDLRIAGIDISADAIEVARGNAQDLNLDVSFTVGDLLDGVSELPDAVLANLPYVPDGAPLVDDVARYEPATALWGGAEGLDPIRRLVASLASAAAAGDELPALLALEIGAEQGAAVAGLVRAAGYPRVEVRRDLAGLDRLVVGQVDTNANQEFAFVPSPRRRGGDGR
jgi:release factor glutamine methyltransferase